MKQVIYSEHHRGIVEYPLLEKPRYMDYNPGTFDAQEFKKRIEAYNKWLSSPPIAQVQKEFIEFFSVPRTEDVDFFLDDEDTHTGNGSKRLVAIPKKEKDDAFIQKHLERIKILTKEAKDSIQEYEYCNMCKDMRYCAENRICLQSKKEKDFEPSNSNPDLDSVASHSCAPLSLLDKWALQNIVDAEQEFKNETNPECKQFLNGVIAALQDVRTHIADSNKKLNTK